MTWIMIIKPIRNSPIHFNNEIQDKLVIDALLYLENQERPENKNR